MYWLFIGVIFCSQEADSIVVEYAGLVQNVGGGPLFTSLLLSLVRGGSILGVRSLFTELAFVGLPRMHAVILGGHATKIHFCICVKFPDLLVVMLEEYCCHASFE